MLTIPGNWVGSSYPGTIGVCNEFLLACMHERAFRERYTTGRVITAGWRSGAWRLPQPALVASGSPTVVVTTEGGRGRGRPRDFENWPIFWHFCHGMVRAPRAGQRIHQSLKIQGSRHSIKEFSTVAKIVHVPYPYTCTTRRLYMYGIGSA